LTNNMGLKTVLAYRPSTRLEVARDDTSADSFERWKQLQLENFHARRWLFVAGLLAFLVLLSAAVELHGDWVALVLGAGLVIIATQLTCYYAAGFIAFALLWKTLPWTGWALALLSFMTCVAALGLPDTDSLYVLLSAAYVVFAVIVTAALARRRLDAPAEVIPE
jgi:O-antigen/teichoic acid export membrane protein